MTLIKNKQELAVGSSRRSVSGLWLSTCAIALTGAASGQLASGEIIANNTPRFVATAPVIGPVNPSTIIDVSIWLQPHDRAGMDQLAAQINDPHSPYHRKFLTRKELASRFAPTQADARTVQQFFASHALKVVKVDQTNFFVRARGTVSNVENAFGVHLNNYAVGKKTIRANDRDPSIVGAAALVSRSVSGLDTAGFDHPVSFRPAGPGLKSNAVGTSPSDRTATLAALTSSGTAGTNPPGFFSNNCFPGVENESFSMHNTGALPIDTITGNKIALPSNVEPGCGYTPAEIRTAFGLNTLYAEGLDGAGQTIGIVDWCGTPTILQDANIFSKQFGLPALALGSNFTITEIPTPSQCSAARNAEINLDVEWAHAIAPGANINLIVPPSNGFQDLDEAVFMAIDSGLATVISGSYGAIEAGVPRTELDTGNLISEVGSMMGISTNFSTGDGGDNAYANGFPSLNYPADVPYATAIGGTALALNADNSIKWQRGWGEAETLIARNGTTYQGPVYLGFLFGSTGGPSNCYVQGSDGVGGLTCLDGFPKPSYQASVPGAVRQVPDISWLADPLTGAVIYVSTPGTYPPGSYGVIGGTSLACPMFSALWAIANQAARAPLGLAAPYVYSVPAATITDIVPQSDSNNVTEEVVTSTGTTTYDAALVARSTAPVITGIWDYPATPNTAVVIVLDSDSTLQTSVGWDNVTGMGVPNPVAFVHHFRPGTP